MALVSSNPRGLEGRLWYDALPWPPARSSKAGVFVLAVAT